jgi:ABC-type iron transport system FetAB ATPase subunit
MGNTESTPPPLSLSAYDKSSLAVPSSLSAYVKIMVHGNSEIKLNSVGTPDLISLPGANIHMFMLAPPGKCAIIGDPLVRINLNDMERDNVNINDLFSIDTYLSKKYKETDMERQKGIKNFPTSELVNLGKTYTGFDFLIEPLFFDGKPTDLYFNKFFQIDRDNYSISVQEPGEEGVNILEVEKLINYVMRKKGISRVEAEQLINTVIEPDQIIFLNGKKIIGIIQFKQLYKLLNDLLGLPKIYFLDNSCTIFSNFKDRQLNSLIYRKFMNRGYDLDAFLSKDKDGNLVPKKDKLDGGMRSKQTKNRKRMRYSQKRKNTKGLKYAL